ncbi:MAG: hypothetical protein J6X91_05490 [Bacteroidales bacterium]|nr:hypothetical protein [Bacteroidales bacterium]
MKRGKHTVNPVAASLKDFWEDFKYIVAITPWPVVLFFSILLVCTLLGI